MQKELLEELKKIPLLKRSASQDGIPQGPRVCSSYKPISRIDIKGCCHPLDAYKNPLCLDAFGWAIDKHGNVVNVTKPSNLSTLKVNINKQKKNAFQILKPDLDVDPKLNPHFDERMGVNENAILRPKWMNFQFVEEGKRARDAKHIKLKLNMKISPYLSHSIHSRHMHICSTRMKDLILEKKMRCR